MFKDRKLKINGVSIGYVSNTLKVNAGKEKRNYNTDTDGVVRTTTTITEAQGMVSFELRATDDNFTLYNTWFNNGDANVISITGDSYNTNGTKMSIMEYVDITEGGDNNFEVIFKGNPLTNK